MNELLIMLELRARTFFKSVFAFSVSALVKNLASFMIFGGFAVGLFFLTRYFTGYLLQESHIGLFLFHRFLSMALYVFFVTVNVGNMIVAFSTMYRSDEVNFLMAMPISHAKVFLVKFIDNFFYSSSTLIMVGMAVLLGYGSYFDLSWSFYLFTMFFVLGPFMLIAGLIAVIVLMMLIRVAARIGVRALLTILVSGYLAAIYVYFRTTNPVQLVHEVMKHYPNVNEYFGYLDPPFVQYLPNHWVTEFLYWSINGEPARAIPYFTLLFLTMLGLVALAGLLAHRYYYASWVAAGDLQPSGQQSSRVGPPVLSFWGRSFFSPQTDVLIKRDFWMFMREPTQWLHLMLMVLLLMIFLVSVGTLQLKLTQPLLQAVSVLIVFMFVGFLVAAVSLRFVFPAVSLEGDAFWCVRSSPMSLSRLYWYKFGVAFVFVLLVAEILSIVSIGLLRENVFLVAVAAVCMVFVTLALISLNMGAGTYFATFKEKNPIRVASSQGASLTFLAGMVYLTAVSSILIIPLKNYFEAHIRFGEAPVHGVFAPMAAIALVSSLMFLTFNSVGLRAIKRDL